MEMTLPYIWAVIILFSIMMYVVMDGFDLGIGILYPFFQDKEDRDLMMNSVAPVWDGNETWLVMGGAGLLAAFPLAYAVILSACYLPLIFMLMGLIFRGVAFEFRFKAHEHERHFWDKAFIGGSVVATFFQGVTLGAYIQGFQVTGRAFAGGPLDWLTPFSIFTGLSLLVGYALLGSTWLVMKTEGHVQTEAYRITRKLIWLLLAAIVGVSIWTPFLDADIAQRWFSFPNMLWLSPVPLLVGVSALLLFRAVAR
jgi:cytochrome d ubiquinol oxidase subunit II